MIDYVFEKNTCVDCKEEKIKVIYFPLKGNVCKACLSARSKKHNRKCKGDPKLSWKHTSFRIKMS